MKLRIQDDSLRIRVSRTELAHFLHDGRIQDTIHFGSKPQARLTYALEVSAVAATQTKVRYSPQEVTVVHAPDQVLQWSLDAEVGVYTQVPLGPETVLDVIVEKDFACLDRSDGDNKDTFTNPNAAPVCQVS